MADSTGVQIGAFAYGPFGEIQSPRVRHFAYAGSHTIKSSYDTLGRPTQAGAAGGTRR